MRRILIVDGNEGFRTALKEGLEELGYDVVAVASGVEGIAAALALIPDAIVIELDLPDATGTLVCRRLKAHSKTAAIPVLMVAARGAEEDRIASFEAGAESFVLKPIGVREMQLRLRVLFPSASAAPAGRNGTPILNDRRSMPRKLH